MKHNAQQTVKPASETLLGHSVRLTVTIIRSEPEITNDFLTRIAKDLDMYASEDKSLRNVI